MSLFAFIWDPDFWISNPWFVAVTIFQIWMLVDAVRQGEWIWALIIFATSGFGAFWYYFTVYRYNRSAGSGFELPGAASRERIQELEAKIHHLDHARHHYDLGDIYFRKGKWEKAEACYRNALQRDPNDIDARAHLGQVLQRQGKAREAQAILEKVCNENPKHDYGHSLMAYAESLTALGERDGAITVWKMVLEGHSYARARVQLAELYLAKGQTDLARQEVQEVMAGLEITPQFQRRRERVWLRRAKALRRKIGK